MVTEKKMCLYKRAMQLCSCLNDSAQLPPLALSYNKIWNCISVAALTDVKTVQDGEPEH